MKINYYSKLRRYTETISVTATENRIYVRRRKKKGQVLLRNGG